MNGLLNILGTVDWRDFVTVEFLLSVPTVFCLLIWRKSPWVKPFGRLLATMAALSLFGWAMTVVAVFDRPTPDNGFATMCGLAFGWAYAWIIGAPILVLSFLLRALHVIAMWLQRKLTWSASCRGSLAVCIAILLIGSMGVYPVCLCVKPAEMWKAWDARHYRTKSVQGLVHVQIRESGRIVDVCSYASSDHRFRVEPVSADALLLKSSDAGSQIIRKVDGEWVLHDAEAPYNSK